MKTTKKILLLVLIGMSINTFAQTNEKFIGVKSTVGQQRLDDPIVNLGIFYEHQFSKYFAYNFGMDYKRIFENYLVSYSENYVSIPVNIKFVSDYVNVALGVNLDYCTGVHVFNNATVSTNSVDDFVFGTSLKLSKDILLAKYFIIEPEVALSYVPSFEGFEYKLGFKFKYQIPEKHKFVKL